MAEFAPTAIHALFDLIHARIPDAQLSGILGDQSHTYGYHRARAVLPPSDYSVELAEDKLGDAWSASALDVKLPTALMETVTARLMTAMKGHDPRVKALREFFGTLNGSDVTGWDQRSPTTPYDDCATTSDDSHLWHVHLSIYREFANDANALAPIADVIAGVQLDEEEIPVDQATFNKLMHGWASSNDGKADIQRAVLEIEVGKPGDDKAAPQSVGTLLRRLRALFGKQGV